MSDVCPVCNGTCRVPAKFDPNVRWASYVYGYDSATHTVMCDNCGGQYMYGRPSGKVPLRSDGTPCTHEYRYTQIGNCLRKYTCIHCKDTYEIDSGD